MLFRFIERNYPDTCTVMTHVGRLVLLNDIKLINEIFIGRADMVSNKIDGYIENQLRYKEGKHVRTGRRRVAIDIQTLSEIPDETSQHYWTLLPFAMQIETARTDSPYISQCLPKEPADSCFSTVII
jgi:hypothetical protein